MSKLELDDQILNHDKFVLAVKRAGKFGGDVVFLWLGIRAYCGQRLSDGFVPTEMLDEVRGPLNPKQRAAALKVLVEVGLLEPVEGGLQMHDFLQWSRSKSQVLADRERARERQAKSRGQSHTQSRRDSGGSNGGSSGIVTKASASASASEEREIPPPPSEPRQARPDPFAASFRPMRADVTELHEAWRRTTGKTGHKLRGGAMDLEATTLADAIDLHGLADCLAILRVAMQDGMVNGSADEKRQKHDSIRYLFGNEQTFSRLLMAAQKSAQKSAGNGALERAMTAEPDTSDVYVPSSGSPQ